MSLTNTTYDLVTAKGDYPQWQGQPQRTLLVCSHPRSGSTLLGEDLYATGVFGCPLEYFHRGFSPAFAERWGTRNLAALRDAAHHHRTDASGLFSSKVFWRDIEDIVDESDPALAAQLRATDNPPSANALRRVHALLADWFPNPTFIHLTRLDRLRQAISAMVATQTQQWRAIPGQGRNTPLGPVVYDYEQIVTLLSGIDRGQARWRDYFAANGITPHRLHYEALLTDQAPALSALFAALGYAGALPARRMQRQASAVSEQVLQRFLAEYQQRGFDRPMHAELA
ncbi:MAG: Stf0 family sulfotransferase [Pseudomonadota bacterium]